MYSVQFIRLCVFLMQSAMIIPAPARIKRRVEVDVAKAHIPLRRLPRNFPVRESFGEVGVMEF